MIYILMVRKIFEVVNNRNLYMCEKNVSIIIKRVEKKNGEMYIPCQMCVFNFFF